MIKTHRYNAHSRLIAIRSRPSQVALAAVLVVDDTDAVSAAITGTRRDAFRHEVVAGVRHKAVVTDATIRCDAVAVLAASLADRFADTFVSRREAGVACAAIRFRALAIEAALSAERRATAVDVLRVAILTSANVRRDARRVSAAGNFADRLANARRAVAERESSSMRLDPGRIVPGVAAAYVRRAALAVDAVEVANRLADRAELLRRVGECLVEFHDRGKNKFFLISYQFKEPFRNKISTRTILLRPLYSSI